MTTEPPAADAPEDGVRRDSMTGRVLRGAGLSSGGYLFAQLLNLGVYMALSRLVAPAEFGRYTSATVLFAFGVLVTEGGLHSAIVQRRDRLEEAMSTAWAATVVGGTGSALLGLAISPLLGAIFADSRVTALAAASSGLVFVNTIAIVPNAILQRRLSSLIFTLVGPLEVIAFGAVSIALAAQGFGAWALVVGQYAAFVTSTSSAWILAGWRPQPRLVSFAMWRELAAYGRHVLVSTAIQRFGSQIVQTVIIGRVLGQASLGQFRYGMRIATLLWTVVQTGAAYVIFPAFARIRADRDRLRAAYLRSLRWMSVLGFPAGAVLIPLGPALTVTFFGHRWQPAGAAAVALCATAAGGAVSATATELLKADGDPSPLVRINLLSAAVTAVAMLALTPLGLTATAAGVSVASIAGAAYSALVSSHRLEVPLGRIGAELWAPAAAAAVMALVLLPLDRLVLRPTTHGTATALVLLVVEGLLATAVYAVTLVAVAPHLLREARALGGGRFRLRRQVA